MTEPWTGAPQGDLPEALAEFQQALPGWWLSIGLCSVSAHASCGPDIAGDDSWLLASFQFDTGFHADLAQPATLAAALRNVTAQGVAAVRLATEGIA